MKLAQHMFVLASLSLAAFALGGCAADTTPDAPADDAAETAVSQDELNARGLEFVGSYHYAGSDSVDFVDIAKLALNADGKYTAMVDSALVNPNVRCVVFPCTLPESGTWSVVKSGAKLKLKLDSTGSKPTRSYVVDLVKQSRILSLTRIGKTTKLFPDGSTCANVRCSAGNHCEMVPRATGGAAPTCAPDVPVAACLKTGCSGQICSDQSVFTTCEFRAEYACYATATCERQSDGACGWTPTAALTSCLGKN